MGCTTDTRYGPWYVPPWEGHGEEDAVPYVDLLDADDLAKIQLQGRIPMGLQVSGSLPSATGASSGGATTRKRASEVVNDEPTQQNRARLRERFFGPGGLKLDLSAPAQGVEDGWAAEANTITKSAMEGLNGMQGKGVSSNLAAGVAPGEGVVVPGAARPPGTGVASAEDAMQLDGVGDKKS